MSEVAEVAARMRRQAVRAGRDHPRMQVHGHLEDAAGQLEIGNHDGAERHLRAAMQALTPKNLYRHSQLTDNEHLAARAHIALLERHLLDVKDCAEMNAPAGNPIGRPSGTANGPSGIAAPAGHPVPARSWIKAGEESARTRLFSNGGAVIIENEPGHLDGWLEACSQTGAMVQACLS